MSNRDFHTAISHSRYSRYLSACGNKRRALRLYRANIILSQKMYAVIGIFEIILRNSIDQYLISKKGPLWLEDAVDTGGFLDIHAGCEYSFHVVQEAIHSLGTEYTHDRLITKLSLGFWRYQFAAKDYAASGSILLNIFINRPYGTKQKDIYHKLVKINETRNRIAHYEPICFDRNIISTSMVQRRYQLILELLQWLGYNPAKVLYGIDGVRNAIAAINRI